MEQLALDYVSDDKKVVPQGYRLTEVGVIPEDWIAEPLESFTSFISYGFTNPMPTTESGPHMITAKDISNGKIQYNNARKTDIHAFNTLLSPKSKPRKKDLLLTKDGTLGRVALTEDEVICINQSVAILRPNSRIEPNFFKALLESSIYQEKMLEDAGGSTIKHIYITIVNKMILGVPRDIKEQTAIADALSDVDALISQLEKLIAKKQAIKTATMQQLLTGKTRLPSFALREDGSPKGYKMTELGEVPEDWEIFQLKDVANIERGKFSARPRNAPKYFGGVIPFIQTGDITRSNGREVNFSQTLNEKGLEVSRLFPANSLYFTIAANIGDVAIVKYESACPDSVVVFSEKSHIDKNWLYHILFTRKSEFELIATSNAQLNINLEKLNPYKICIPPKQEQTAIASILSDMDNDIQQLNQRLNKTRHIKQGMMQELLTGKTRLINLC